MQKNFLFVFISFVFILMASNQAYCQENTQPTFLETADSGVIQYDTKNHTSILRLKNVEPCIIYFNQNQNPKQNLDLKFMKLNDFTIQMNDHIQKSSAPGLPADLMSFSIPKDDSQHQTMILSNPKYNSKSKTLSFIIIAAPKKPLPKKFRFKHGTLFIQFCAECAGRGV